MGKRRSDTRKNVTEANVVGSTSTRRRGGELVRLARQTMSTFCIEKSEKNHRTNGEKKIPGNRRRETCVHKMSQDNADYSMFMQAGCTGTGTLGRLLTHHVSPRN